MVTIVAIICVTIVLVFLISRFVCKHKYEVVADLTSNGECEHYPTIYTRTIYLQCKKCKKFKKEGLSFIGSANMKSITTEHFVVGLKKLKPGNLVRIELHNTFTTGSKIRTVVGRVKSIKERDDTLNIVIVDALDDWTWDSIEKTKQTVEFEWFVRRDNRYYYLDKDSDLVSYDYKYIISNATDASLRALAKRIKQIHLKHIKEWRYEVGLLQKEIDGYNVHIKTANKFVKNFERTYKI